MLFGYLTVKKEEFADDVQSTELCIECFAFDRPMILATELHVAGAMAFAASCGFGGMSLVEWALMQTIDSANQRHQEVTLPQNEHCSGKPIHK